MRKLAVLLVIIIATVAASAQKHPPKPGPGPQILPGLCRCGCMPAAMHCNGAGGGIHLCTPTSNVAKKR